MQKLKFKIYIDNYDEGIATVKGVKEYAEVKTKYTAIDDAALAIKVGVTKKTIQNKYHRPETYSLDEMQKIATVLKFTPIQAASVLLGRELTSKEIKEFILL